uniref:Uncharacterized protein n=1 Tax=Oncorhynchus kisutch TaxID=8019 RepID=A0A8C7FWR0_ONCKI
MDWIRVAKSGRDLTGMRGRLIDVTEEELQKHNTRATVGPAYEVTQAKEEELMKAAGIDGTDLFDQIYRWVNYESMLKECLVGRMAVKASTALKGTVTQNPSVSGL